MNEVREVCAAMLEAAEPPLRPAGEMLRLARQAKRRRDWGAASGLSAAVLALVVGVGVALTPGQDSDPADLVAGPYSADVPLAQAAPAHSQIMAGVLRAAVPSGFRVLDTNGYGAGDELRPTAAARPGAPEQLLAGASIQLGNDTGIGELFAYLVYDGRPVPAGDLCRQPRSSGTWISCSTRQVGRVAIRVQVTVDSVRGQVVTATRFLNGGRLVVGALQGIPADSTTDQSAARWRLPPLAAPPLSEAAIAVLAANPALLPVQ